MSFLKQQTQALQQEFVAITHSGMRKNIPSLIFGQNAKQVPMQTVYEISLAALHELQTHSELFYQFEQSIFAKESITFDRDVAQPEVVSRIDVECTKFIRALVGHFQNECALKALEFLIRRYRIDLYLTDELVFDFLCYHDLEQYGILIRAIKPKLFTTKFDGLKFPQPRNQLTQFFSANSFEFVRRCLEALGQLTSTSSRQIYTRFIYTEILELLSLRVKNCQELVRIALTQAYNDLKKKQAADNKYYALALIALCCNNFRDLVSHQFVDKVLMVLVDQADIATEDVQKFALKTQRSLDYKPNELNANRLLKRLMTLKPEQLNDDLVEVLITVLLMKQQLPQIKLVASLVALAGKNATNLNKTLRTVVRLSLKIHNNSNNAETKDVVKGQILNVIEDSYTNQFNEGLMDYLKNGGQLQQIQSIINNQLCVFLNQSVDNQNSTLVQALQSNNADVRYQAYLNLQNMSASIDAKLRPQLESYIFNLMEFEADLHVLKMQLRFLSMSQEALQITNDEPLVSVWKRIVVQQNNQVYELCGLL